MRAEWLTAWKKTGTLNQTASQWLESIPSKTWMDSTSSTLVAGTLKQKDSDA